MTDAELAEMHRLASELERQIKALRAIADLAAQRDFHRNPEHQATLLGCIAAITNRAGFGATVDVL